MASMHVTRLRCRNYSCGDTHVLVLPRRARKQGVSGLGSRVSGLGSGAKGLLNTQLVTPPCQSVSGTNNLRASIPCLTQQPMKLIMFLCRPICFIVLVSHSKSNNSFSVASAIK